MLRPPAFNVRRTPWANKSVMSRRAVSGEHVAIAAHLLPVSLPSKSHQAAD